MAMFRVVSLTRLRPELAGHTGAQHDPRGGTRGQAGDADLVALAGYCRALHLRIETHPVPGVEIVAAGGGDREVDAGARRFGLGLGGDAADQDAGGTTRFVQLLHDRLVVRRTFGGGLQCLDRLRRAVQHLQRVGHQQQGRHLRCAGLRGREVLPSGLEGVVGPGRSAAHLRLGQRQPLCRRCIALRDARLPRRCGTCPVLLADCRGGCLFRLLARLRRAASGEPRCESTFVCRAVGLEARQGEVIRPRHAAGEAQQCREQQSEPAHNASPPDQLAI